MGRLVLPALSFGRRRVSDVARVTGWLSATAVATLAVHALPSGGLALPESRRLANLAYAAWIIGFCCTYLAVCAFHAGLFHLLAGPYPPTAAGDGSGGCDR